MDYLNQQADRHPLLTPGEELRLATIVQRWLTHPDPVPPKIKRAGLRARERFAAANIRLVYSICSKYQSKMQYDQRDDIIQAGMMGLLRGIEKFDPTRGYKFSTYAYWWIRQAINRHLESHYNMIALPHGRHTRYRRLLQAEATMTAELGRAPTDAELAAKLGWALATIPLVRHPPVCSHSIDYVINDDTNSTVHHFLTTDQEEVGIDAVIDAIAQLPDLHQRVIKARYFGERISNADLAAQLGVGDRSQITAIIKTSIHALQQLLGVDTSPSPPGGYQTHHAAQNALL
jgi:RNA polymerase sigma factor (sigma-70 family)